ncbi:MAG: hypothetical protein ACTSWQ_00105 [Candidatus Thorarchaeota archaeon]
MTNMIHDFALNAVQGYSFSRKEARIEGYETTKENLMSLVELFGRAEWNVIFKQRPAGQSYIMDLTNDQRNIVYCDFDTEELISGWYALKSFAYIPRAGRINFFPYRISLIFIGTMANYQQFYGIVDMETVSNDWSI